MPVCALMIKLGLLLRPKLHRVQLEEIFWLRGMLTCDIMEGSG